MIIKKSIRVNYSTSMDKDLIQKLKVYCVLKGYQQNELLEKIIGEYLEKEGDIDGANKCK